MVIQQKTSEKLRDLITHETEYRKGSQLVDFFNSLGFSDVYGQGFPSVHSKRNKRNKPCIPMVCLRYNFCRSNGNILYHHLNSCKKAWQDNPCRGA